MAIENQTRAELTNASAGIAAALKSQMNRRGMLKRSLALGLSVPAMGALLAACGGGAKSTATAAVGAATTKVTGAGGTATSARTPSVGTGAGSMTGTMTGGMQTIETTNQLKFNPADVTIKVGDTVTWSNTGSVAHTATGDPSKASNKADVKLPDGAETWDSGTLNAGQTFSHTFTVAGDYQYICIPHEAAGMIGKITVQK